MDWLPKIFFIALLLLSVGCNETCDENRNALPLAGFYVNGDLSSQVVVDSLEVVGVGMKGDSVLSEASTAKSQIYMPFKIDSDTTSYVLIDKHQDSSLRDTLTFIYTRKPQFVNVECGVSYLFGIQKIHWQGALVDSVTCPQGYIDNSNIENIRIYLATSQKNE